MESEAFKRALRRTESDDNPRAFGDGGMALTSYQVHPAWVWDQVQRFGASARPKVGDTWELAIGGLVALFHAVELAAGRSDLEAAMHFHLGHPSDPSKADWDQPYADRFARFAGAGAT